MGGRPSKRAGPLSRRPPGPRCRNPCPPSSESAPHSREPKNLSAGHDRHNQRPDRRQRRPPVAFPGLQATETWRPRTALCGRPWRPSPASSVTQAPAWGIKALAERRGICDNLATRWRVHVGKPPWSGGEAAAVMGHKRPPIPATPRPIVRCASECRNPSRAEPATGIPTLTRRRGCRRGLRRWASCGHSRNSFDRAGN
jgi:hypothetical protein